MNYAPRSQRLLGQIIDDVVGVGPLVITLVLARLLLPFALLAWPAYVWAIFYWFFGDAMRDGQSIGKAQLGMRVLVEATGEPCTFARAFTRNLLLAALGPLDW